MKKLKILLAKALVLAVENLDHPEYLEYEKLDKEAKEELNALSKSIRVEELGDLYSEFSKGQKQTPEWHRGAKDFAVFLMQRKGMK